MRASAARMTDKDGKPDDARAVAIVRIGQRAADDGIAEQTRA